jgi:dTDP-4-dehydrorhamnose 3,5-epimerase
VVSEFATFTYQCTALYDAKADAGIRWNDAALGIDWPVSDPVLSDKDRETPLLADVPSERLPVYEA